MIFTNANPGLCNPKKIIDQSTLSANCPANMSNAIFTFLSLREAAGDEAISYLFFQIKKAAAPIKANNIVQTGAKIHAGGLIAGLASAAYQVGMEGMVKIEPIIPADSHIAIAIINFIVSLTFIFYII